MVLAEMVTPSIELVMCRATSARLQRARGVPVCTGKLQAIAVTCART